MFQFDKAALPKLSLRKALVIVDFQQDFVSPHGTLSVVLPKGFADRTTELARFFREIGDVIWVNSKLEQERPPYGEQIVSETSEYFDGRDMVADLTILNHWKGRCLLSSKVGGELPQTTSEEAEGKDVVIEKSHQSAFEGTSLLRLLRARMTMEVYICGTLINSGVYATAVDAAGHGMQITIVGDCCGYLSEKKQVETIEALMSLTGCGLTSSVDIIQQDDEKIVANGAADADDEIELSMRAMTLGSTVPRETGDGSRRDTYDGTIDRRRQKSLAGHHGSRILDEKLTHHLAIAHPQPMIADINVSSNADTLTKANGLRSLCEGDTDVIEGFLPPELAVEVFETLNKEIHWQHMSHRGGKVPRLVAIQGEVKSDGSYPIYRHPIDDTLPLLPFSPTVLAIKAEAEKYLGHHLNHALIQFYRSGNDYISEHSDKTLDIVRGSYIAIASLGAQRTLVFRTKNAKKDSHIEKQTTPHAPSRKVQQAPLPHNSLCRMGLKTNMKWLHSIRQDKRADKDKSQEERDFEGGRISLTFRHIGTFLNKEGNRIWGQGATGKSFKDAQDVVNGQTEESVQMLRVFSAENRSSNFDWDGHYGQGFNILHLRSEPTFFASVDFVVNLRISLMLAEYEINSIVSKIARSETPKNQADNEKQKHAEDVLIKYVDNDAAATEVCGDVAIMLYLYSSHHRYYQKSPVAPEDLGRQFTLFQKALNLLKTWRRLEEEEDIGKLLVSVKPHITTWANCTCDKTYIGGERPNLADFAFWPVLHSVVLACGQQTLAEHSSLNNYYEVMKTRANRLKNSERLD